jgi:molecular chaperone GrpE (heat shock protein)
MITKKEVDEMFAGLYKIIDNMETALNNLEKKLKEDPKEKTCPHGYPQTVRCSRCGE